MNPTNIASESSVGALASASTLRKLLFYRLSFIFIFFTLEGKAASFRRIPCPWNHTVLFHVLHWPNRLIKVLQFPGQGWKENKGTPHDHARRSPLQASLQSLSSCLEMWLLPDVRHHCFLSSKNYWPHNLFPRPPPREWEVTSTEMGLIRGNHPNIKWCYKWKDQDRIEIAELRGNTLAGAHYNKWANSILTRGCNESERNGDWCVSR